MNTQRTKQSALRDFKLNVQVKIAALWASLMFLIIYLDYFHLYMPQKIEDILEGKVFVFDITPEFILIALVLVTIPALMIYLSIALPAKINRWTNIIIAAVNMPLIFFNLAGEAWIHMVVGVVIQFILLCLIIHYAWKWPQIEA